MKQNYWVERIALKTLMTPHNLKELRKQATPTATGFNMRQPTLKEKYEAVYLALLNRSQQLLQKGGVYPLWVVLPPDVAAIFAIATNQQYKPSQTEVEYIGTLNGLWRLYCDPFAKNEILFGSKWNINLTPMHIDMMCF